MFYNAKNGNIKIGDTDMDYISFGKGKRNLIMISGLSDGLKTVKGSANVMAMMYRQYSKNFKVYIFSRKNKLEKGYSTKDMAKDQKTAMEKLGISKADILGVSQGGMIAQYIAIDYPELVRKLVLAVTLSKTNMTVNNVINSWIKMAESNDYEHLFIDTTEKSYTENYVKRYRIFYPILSKIGKPKDFNRFIIQANACIHHNAYDELNKIKCPTLVIGVDNDKVVGNNSSEEIAEKINDSKLIMYKGFGHGVYTELNDFNIQVLKYLE